MDTKLHKSKTDKIICGVCGGLAETYGGKASYYRLGVILFSIFGFFLITIIFYIVLACVLDSQTVTKQETKENDDINIKREQNINELTYDDTISFKKYYVVSVRNDNGQIDYYFAGPEQVVTKGSFVIVVENGIEESREVIDAKFYEEHELPKNINEFTYIK